MPRNPTRTTQSDVTPFGFGDHLVRVVMRDGDPWFIAADVCSALGIGNPSAACEKLDADEKGISSTDTLGGAQEALLISESGLYILILRCREATTPGSVAHRFRKWVTGEVLPQIRKFGSYGAPNASERVAEHHVRLIREARLLFGTDAARALWRDLGLPLTPAMGAPKGPDAASEQISRWKAERLAQAPGASIKGCELWDDYVNWACGREAIVTRTMFGRRLPELGVAKTLRSWGVEYVGVRLVALPSNGRSSQLAREA